MGTANVSFGRSAIVAITDPLPALFDKIVSENITTAIGSSVPTVNRSALPGTQNRYRGAVRILMTNNGYVEIGPAPVAAVGTSMWCLANTEYYFAVEDGDAVAILEVATV